MSPVYIGPTLGQRSISTTFIKNQSDRHTLVQCWPNVMHPTQLGHVKTSRRCTLAQRWVNVVFATTFIKNQSDRHTLVQCWPNVMHPTQLGHVKTSRRCTSARRWFKVVFSTTLSKTKVAGKRWSNVGPT